MKTGLALLAAGASARFETGDKLLADLCGETVLARSLLAVNEARFSEVVGIVGPGHQSRRDVFASAGWPVVEASDAAQGQGRSIAAAAQWAMQAGLDGLIIALADMPLTPPSHFAAVTNLLKNFDAVRTDAGRTSVPPTAFRRALFDDLAALLADDGAKRVLQQVHQVGAVRLSPDLAYDIDTVSDLGKVREVYARHAPDGAEAIEGGRP